MKAWIVFILTVLIAPIVYAQIDSQTIADSGAQCGDGVREQYEPCDPSSTATDADLCPSIGKVAGIAMVCREEICSCLPRKYILCGDKHTKGNEMCDPPDKDFCPEVSALAGVTLECNTKTCLCKAPDGVLKVETPVPEKQESLCGNRKVDAQEECDPPGRMCTFEGVAGICSEECACRAVPSDEPVSSPVEQPPEEPKEEVDEEDATGAVVDEQEENVEEESAAGLSDATYTVILILLVVLFLGGLGIGSYVLFRRSQLAVFERPKE